MTTLVIGGAGYIGAHVVRLLHDQRDLVVVDDLSTGSAERVDGTDLVDLDIAAPHAEDALADLMRERGADSVIHFAAKKQVGESVERSTYYYAQNVGGLANVLGAMERAGVRRLLFSSSAATYGAPPNATSGYLTEDLICAPLSPYGETKLVGEWMCRDAGRAWGLRWAALRYFNVAGSGWPDLGDPAVLNLVPIVFSRMSQGRRPLLYGDDYDTPDGTCIRDYVHVLDLADAHATALDHLDGDAGGAESPHVFNVGTGTGSSVREVLATIAEVTGQDTTPEVVARRPGDPAVLAADVSRIADTMGWHAKLGLEDMVRSAWEAWA